MEKFKNREFKKNGGVYLGLYLLIVTLCAVSFVGSILVDDYLPGLLMEIFLIIRIVIFIGSFFMLSGFKVIKPNEALVLTLFGNFYGVLKLPGFYYVNPFVSATYPKSDETDKNTTGTDEVKNVNIATVKRKISLKAMTLNNRKQKVNDANGNPIEIGVVVIWKVIDPVKAVFDVEDYRAFVSIQSDSAIRTVARLYAYDGEEGTETLTSSTQEISDRLQEVIQESVVAGGIEIIDAKIAHLAYSPEIASAMLQRQQADAIISARQKIVEGAVGMVEQALNQLSERDVVELDDERKAQMVSNLLVVLCANKDTQPIVNSGSIY